jgi:hypothetical protein
LAFSRMVCVIWLTYRPRLPFAPTTGKLPVLRRLRRDGDRPLGFEAPDHLFPSPIFLHQI